MEVAFLLVLSVLFLSINHIARGCGLTHYFTLGMIFLIGMAVLQVCTRNILFGHIFMMLLVVVGHFYYSRKVEKYNEKQQFEHRQKERVRAGAFDYLKVFLTILVVAHHSVCQFGTADGQGGWVVQYPYSHDEVVYGGLSSWLAWVSLAFTNVNVCFFMPLFFFVSGYFTPGSFKKKGLYGFLRDRFSRLGLPCIWTLVVLNPIWLVYVSGFRLDAVSFRGRMELVPLSLKFDSGLDVLVDYLASVFLGFGVMWYAAWLLLLSFWYAYSMGDGEVGYVRHESHGMGMLKFKWVLAGSFTFGLLMFGIEWVGIQMEFLQMPVVPVSVIQNIGCFWFGCYVFERFDGEFIICFRGWMDRGLRRLLMQTVFCGLVFGMFYVYAGAFSEFQEIGRTCEASDAMSTYFPFARKIDVYRYFQGMLSLKTSCPMSPSVPPAFTWCLLCFRLVYAAVFLPISGYVLLDFCITLDRWSSFPAQMPVKNYSFSVRLLDYVKRISRYMYGVYIFHPLVLTLSGVLVMWLYEEGSGEVVNVLISPRQSHGTLDLLVKSQQESILPVEWRLAGLLAGCLVPVFACAWVTHLLMKFFPSTKQIL